MPCQPAQNHPKSYILFHKNDSLRDFYIMTLVRYKKLTKGSTVVRIAKFCPNIMGPLFVPGGTFSYCKALKFLNNIKQNQCTVRLGCILYKDESLETLLTLFGLLVAKNICKKEKKDHKTCCTTVNSLCCLNQ